MSMQTPHRTRCCGFRKHPHLSHCQLLAQKTSVSRDWGMPAHRTKQPAPPRRDDGPDPSDFAEAAETFALLATATRIRLLWLLAQGEHDVTTLASAVGATVATVSQHLAKLRLADLVTARPEGRRQIYRVDDPHILDLVNQAVDHHRDLRIHSR